MELFITSQIDCDVDEINKTITPSKYNELRVVFPSLT